MADGIVAMYYGILSTVFGPIVGLPPIFSEIILATIIIFIITLFYKYMINQNAMKEIKGQVKKYQDEIKKVQKENPEKVKEMMSEMMKLTNKQMKMSFKPMLPTMIFVLLLLPWMASIFAGPIIKVPFYWPFVGSNSFGWLIWYVIISVPMTQIFRKILGVEM